MNQIIRCESAVTLAIICAELVRQGVTFEAIVNGLDNRIVLTGGY